jgi:hypothetical protein
VRLRPWHKNLENATPRSAFLTRGLGDSPVDLDDGYNTSVRVFTPPAPPRIPTLDLSPDAYWLLGAATVGAFALMWFTHFQYVYGWNMDDTIVYGKGVETVRDPRSAFLSFYNALQSYFFVISYLPLKLARGVASYPLPVYGQQTQYFRFFLLYAVFLHSILLAVWLWFAPRISGNRLVAFISLLWFATSPSMLLWSPHPDSRLISAPFALLGIALLLSTNWASGTVNARWLARLFLAGSLLGLAQSIHYTALYLIVPLCLVLWAVWCWRSGRTRRYWLGALVFGVGCVWLQALLEWISYAVVGLAWEKGPLASLLKLRDTHASSLPLTGNLALWAGLFMNQFGIVLIAAVVVGWVAYARSVGDRASVSPLTKLAIAVAVLLSLMYLGLSGSDPFFRQTALVQPFLFVFAATALVGAVGHMPGRLLGRGVALAALTVVVGALSWSQAQAVFTAQQGLGRALAWVNEHRGTRPVEWLYPTTDAGVISMDELEQLPPNTWLIDYAWFPLIPDYPGLRPYLELAEPVAAWPSLWATDAVWAEHNGFGLNDFRFDPAVNTVRILEAGALQQAAAGQPLAVATVSADSSAAWNQGPLSVFDRGAGFLGGTYWRSGNTPMPHWLELRFAEGTRLDGVQVVLPPPFRSYLRIAEMDVLALGADGVEQTVWIGRGLDKYPVLWPRWEPRDLVGLRFVVRRQSLLANDYAEASIDEIVFPGYEVVPPPPAQPPPPLELVGLERIDRGLLVTIENATPRTVLMLQSQRIPLRPLPESGHYLARLPRGVSVEAGTMEAYLLDGDRRSAVSTLPTE